jgi:hypothetical protein
MTDVSNSRERPKARPVEQRQDCWHQAVTSAKARLVYPDEASKLKPGRRGLRDAPGNPTISST